MKQLRPGGFRRLDKRESQEKKVDGRASDALSPITTKLELDAPCDPVISLCQHVWSTVGERLGREDMIALLNALRVPHRELKEKIDDKFRSSSSLQKRLSFNEFTTFMEEFVQKDPEGTGKRITSLYDEHDFDAPASEPSALRVVLLCVLSPITWPIFALDKKRHASMPTIFATSYAWVIIWLVLMVAYVPIALVYPYRADLAADRVSWFECFLPGLFMVFMCKLQASSIGLGWFYFFPSALHKWRRMRVQERFLQRFARNRILLKRLSVAVYGQRADERTIWAFDLLTYLEGDYAAPTGLTDWAKKLAPHPAKKQLVSKKSSRTLTALVAPNSQQVSGLDTLLPPTDDSKVMAKHHDQYFEHDLPDELDGVTHSMAIGQYSLFSPKWFGVRLRRPRTPFLVILSIASLAIPCLVRKFVHQIPFFGAHRASQFVVVLNSLFVAPSVLVVLLTMDHFLDMLEFRKRLLRGLVATVRADLASSCGVRVLLDLRTPENLTTWNHLMSYLRLRCLRQEVVPFNTMLLPALLLAVGLCGMFIWEWIVYHLKESPHYTINALDIISGVTVVWLGIYIIIATSRACDINIALDRHAEVLEATQVDIREAIIELNALPDLDQSLASTELRTLRDANELLTALVRKTRYVDINKPFKLIGVSITTNRLRTLAGILIGGMVSGILRQLDDILFTSFGIEF